MPQVPEEDVMHQPVAFIGIGSKNEQEMQQLIIEDKVRSYAYLLYVAGIFPPSVSCSHWL